MEARIISCLICPATFDSVNVLRTHLLRDHGNGISGETNEKGSHSGNASIEDVRPALRVSLKLEASFEKSKLVNDGISGLSDQSHQTKTVLQQNECPPESNDPYLFPKQCFKEQTLPLSYVEVKQEVQDHGNNAANGPQEGASSTPVKYLDSSTSLNQGGSTNGAEDLKESIHKTNGSSTDGRGVCKKEYQDEPSFVPDDAERMRNKKNKEKGTPVHLDIHVYKLPLCVECGISFKSREHFKVHLDSHNRGMMATPEHSDETCTDPEEMERGITTTAESWTDPEEMKSIGQTDLLPLREGAESVHVSNGASASKKVNISDKVHDKTLKHGVDLPNDIKSNSRTIPQCTEEINDFLETRTLIPNPKMEKGSIRKFGCSVCSKWFLQKGHLKEHMITHTRVYPFKCDVCEMKFKRISELRKHNFFRHGIPQETKVVKTKHAEKRKAAENKSTHPETHSNSRTGPQLTEQIKDSRETGTLISDPNMENRSKRRFGCSVCSKRFICPAHLKEHMITHTKVYPFNCNVCEKKFRRNSELKQHKCLTQGVQKYGTFKTPEMEIQLSETNSYSRTERVSENKKILVVTNESKDLEKEVKKSLNEVDLPIKSDIGNTNSRRKSEFVTCDICNKDVRRRYASHHWAIHNKKYACEICGKRYVIPSDLKTHMMKHTGERPVLCSQCGKGFISQGMLNIHLRSHSSDKPFECSTCGKSFKTTSLLNLHNMTNHSGERTILCHICGKAFFHSSNLRSHMITHEARKYECLICGKAFRTSSKLGQHKLTHSGEKNIKCELCDFRSVDRSGIKAHMRKHSDERPYKCDECEQTFKRKDSKVVHMRIHSGSKPYKCDACDAAFTHYAGLYLHKKRHVHVHSE